MPDLLAPVAPAHLWVPPGARGNYGDEVADVARLLGRPLDAAQRIAVDALTSYGPGGRWLTLEGCIKMPRQNGKTGGIVTPIMLADLFLWQADEIAWTAHLFKTTRKAFADHKRLIQSTPEFDRRVRKIHEANGEESIELTSGARIDYLARSKGGGRGMTGKRVVIDEALFFTGEQGGALLPMLATRRDAQVTYASSACKTESVKLRELTKRGRSGADPSLVFVEWCAPGSWADPGCAAGPTCRHQMGTAGCVLDDTDLAAAANPAIASGRIDRDFLKSMRRTLNPPVEYGREFFGWDEAGPDDIARPIDLDAWDACMDATSRSTGGKVLALDVSPAGNTASIGLVARRSDGKVHLQLVITGPGTAWLAEQVAQLKREHRLLPIRVGDQVNDGVVVDPAGPAGEQVPALKAAGINPYLATARDVGQGCGALQAAVRDQTLVHLGQQPIRDALAGAAKRTIGDGAWAFARRTSEVDITQIVAPTLALQGLRLAEASPPPAPLVARA